MLKTLTPWIMVALLSTACVPLAAPATPTARPTTTGPTISEQDAIELAEALRDSLIQGDFAGATQNFDDKMKAALPEAQLKEVWQGLAVQVGAYRGQAGTPRVEAVETYQRVTITLEFEQAMLDMRVAVHSSTGRIGGLFFAPSQAASGEQYLPPEYVDTRTFEEQEVRVGSGTESLPGTLTMPKGSGPFAAIVLVHGSGPNDRDESLGPNKPFKDIAWGLASRGIAVLRYDKRTKVYGDQIAALKSFTAKEEVVDDALAAVELLRSTHGIDPNAIFVLGHSLGGMLAPRIAQADRRIAGIIVLAGATRPLEDLMLEQTRYVLQLDGDLSAEDQKQIEELAQQVADIKALRPAGALPNETILGAPPQYWLDLQDYDAVQVARALSQPMLILQGERDYQVTLDDLQRWRDALSSRPDVTLKTYPDLNHLFMPGVGKSTPHEYQVAGHVSASLIEDVSTWIGQQ